VGGKAAIPAIHGRCEAKFARLRGAFADNFRHHDEVGGAVAVSLDGQLVVDLWAGWTDRARSREWQRDTLVDVFSVGKPMPVLCLLQLVELGSVSLDAPVAAYWPEFAAAGKAQVTVRTLLSHRAGLAAIRRPLPEGAMYDWELMTAELAAQEPWWEPDTAHGYHTNTYGFLVGELVRRVSGESVGSRFRHRIAEPLQADFHFGLPATEDRRVAEFLFGDPRPDFLAAGAPLLVRQAYLNPPGVSGLGTVNTRAWRAAEMPSSNGHATARGVARIYSALAAGGNIDGVTILGPDTLAQATCEASAGIDRVLARPSRFGLGFQLTQPQRPLGPSPRAFGHFGAGGSVGFADPDARLAFAYTPNQGEGPRWQNPRNRGLIAALYESL
jgi:CubicO group peptidase (beta-lactamase class C family)